MSIATVFLLKLFVLFLLTGCVAGLMVGIWLLVGPQAFQRVNRFFSQWYTTRKATKPLMAPRFIERFVYRHHRAFGFFIVACALYVLYGVLFEYDKASIISVFFGPVDPYPPATWLVPAMATIVGFGGFFALVVGGFLAIRPSLLKGFEAWANRWVSARRATKFLDTMYFGPDQWVMRHPRSVGAVIALASIYALIRLSLLWVSADRPGFAGLPPFF